MSIREIIQNYQNEISNHDLVPDRAAEILTKLASLMGNVNDRILATDLAYNAVLKAELERTEKANRAVINSKTSSEYEAMMQAKNEEKEVVALTRSLNRFLRVKEDEARGAKFQ